LDEGKFYINIWFLIVHVWLFRYKSPKNVLCLFCVFTLEFLLKSSCNLVSLFIVSWNTVCAWIFIVLHTILGRIYKIFTLFLSRYKVVKYTVSVLWWWGVHGKKYWFVCGYIFDELNALKERMVALCGVCFLCCFFLYSYSLGPSCCIIVPLVFLSKEYSFCSQIFI